MLHRHHSTVADLAFDTNLKYLVRDYFNLPARKNLLSAMLDSGLDHADLVLGLLHLRDRHHPQPVAVAAGAFIERLVGHPIAYGTPCLAGYRCGPATHAKLDRSPRLVWVTPTNPRHPGTTAYQRWPEYRVGRSVAQLRIRGVKPKDLRIAQRNGWIKLEEVA